MCHLFVFMSERAWTSSGVYARCSSCLSPNNISSLPYFEDYQNARRSAFQKSFVHDIAFPRVEISSSIERIWAGSSRKNPLPFSYYAYHHHRLPTIPHQPPPAPHHHNST